MAWLLLDIHGARRLSGDSLMRIASIALLVLTFALTGAPAKPGTPRDAWAATPAASIQTSSIAHAPSTDADGRARGDGIRTRLQGLPIEREHRYMVNGRIRPLLLFWIGRGNIGSARFTWRRGEEGRRATEVLIGSDPLRAPRRLNRWGFITEVHDGTSVEVLGLMTDSSERSLEEAAEQLSRETTDSRLVKVLQSTVAGGQVVSRPSQLIVSDEWTYRDLDRVLALIPQEPTTTRTTRVPQGTESGFLTAVTLLMDKLVEPCRHTTSKTSNPLAPVLYVYNATIYRLSVDSCDQESALSPSGETIEAVDGRFVIRNTTTSNVTKFRLIFGATGELRAVPVRLVFRPQWWVEVELTLDDGVTW